MNSQKKSKKKKRRRKGKKMLKGKFIKDEEKKFMKNRRQFNIFIVSLENIMKTSDYGTLMWKIVMGCNLYDKNAPSLFFLEGKCAIFCGL